MTDLSSDFNRAVQRGDRAAVESLLTSNPELANTPYDRATPLHFAAIDNHRDVVDLLLRAGADLNARDEEFNMTPIGWANEKGHGEMVQYLFERGADVDLYAGVAFGLTEVVREHLGRDASEINAMNHYGTPIHEASLWGHVDLVKLLLDHGADPNLRNIHGDTALEIARKQVESNCSATPIVIESRRQEIREGCKRVVEILS